MSMLLMVQAMKCRIGNSARKLVLMKLADNASDDGVCFPSYQHIADQCEMTRRSAINHIDALIEMGLVEKKLRKTQDGNTSNIYFLHLEKASEISAPVVKNLHYPSENISPTPSENISPRTSHSFEPVNEPKKTTQKKTAVDSFSGASSGESFCAEQADLPDFVERADWVDFCEMRRAKGKPIRTIGALLRCLADLGTHSQGNAEKAKAVLDRSIKNEWTGLYPLDDDKPNSRTSSGGAGVGKVKPWSPFDDDDEDDLVGEMLTVRADVAQKLGVDYEILE